MREPNEPFEALQELFGAPKMEHTRKLYGKIAKDFQQAGYSKVEIHRAAKSYRQQWPSVALTPTSLAKWADQMLHAARPSAPRSSPRAQEEDGLMSISEYLAVHGDKDANAKRLLGGEG